MKHQRKETEAQEERNEGHEKIRRNLKNKWVKSLCRHNISESSYEEGNHKTLRIIYKKIRNKIRTYTKVKN